MDITDKCKRKEIYFDLDKVSPASKTVLPRDFVTPEYSAVLTWKVVAFVMGLGFVTMVVLNAVLFWGYSSCPKPATPIFPEIPDSPSNFSDGVTTKLRLIRRSEWGAQPPTEPLDKLKLPVPYVIISHTATDFCDTQTTCTFRVRYAQTFDIESRGWSDIAYNFLVGGDGCAYVGRSWDFVGVHAYGYNAKSIGISFIGTFNKVVPPKHQLLAAQKIIEMGVKGGKIAPDYKLLGHRQVSRTLSPGDALYNVIQTWPHWSPTP